MNKYDYSIPDEGSIRYVGELLEKDESDSYLRLVLESLQRLHICLKCGPKFYPKHKDFHPSPSCPACGTKLVRPISDRY